VNGQTVISIVVADDHAGMRDAIRCLLERVPMLHVAGEAVDGTAAVRMARELKPDVVLMDVSMPGLSGIEAARLIVDATKSRVVMLSLQGERQVVDEAFRAGATGYLLKQDASRELVRAIGCVMSGRRYFGPSCAITSEGDAAQN
jgi:DNA-binding NarL/FixJ family response regulator